MTYGIVPGVSGRYEYDPSTLTITCRGCLNRVLAVEKSEVYMGSGAREGTAWVVAECPDRHCHTVVFIEYDTLNHCVHRTYPYGYVEASDFNQAIPDNIRRDLAEAEVCRRAQAYRAAVVMQRRVVESIAKEQLGEVKVKAANADNLKKKIKLLSKEGLITKQIEEEAQEIREFGNYGAHPSDDGLDLDITSEELELIDNLVYSIVDTIYIKPDKLAKLKAKRNGTDS